MSNGVSKTSPPFDKARGKTKNKHKIMELVVIRPIINAFISFESQSSVKPFNTTEETVIIKTKRNIITNLYGKFFCGHLQLPWQYNCINGTIVIIIDNIKRIFIPICT
jgi:hypothetical protein